MSSQVVTIEKVHEVQEGRSYTAKNGRNAGKEMYPTCIKADVNENGTLYDTVEVQIVGLKPGQHMLADHISDGTKVCVYEPRDNKYGRSYSVAINDTKKLLGVGAPSDGYSGHSGGGGRDSVGMEVGAAMHDAATLLSAQSGNMSPEALEEAMYVFTKMCLRVADKVKAERSQASQDAAHGAASPSAQPDTIAQIKKALRGEAQIENKLATHPDPQDLCERVWGQVNGDTQRFVTELKDALNIKQDDGEDAGLGNFPF